MTLSRWILRNLYHYRRLHLAVGLAAAVATAALTGALVVGDSVRETLRYAQRSRLGSVASVVATQERFFGEDLGQRLDDGALAKAPVLQLRGILTNGDGSIRINRVNVLGVDDRFFQLSPAGNAPVGFKGDGIWVNTLLTKRLQLTPGSNSEVVVRIDKPGALSRDLMLAPVTGHTVAARLPAMGSVNDSNFGRFGLEANQQIPLNVFVPLNWLQRQIGRDGHANLLLIGGRSGSDLEEALRKGWRLADAETTLNPVGMENVLELRSDRVFLDPSLGRVAHRIHPASIPILTYFVNELRVGNRSTPYSMVSAVERKGAFVGILPDAMGEDQIVINRWLADDLNATVGDELILSYFLPTGRRLLEEVSRSFNICRIVPVEGIAADPSLMPDFPGLADVDNCRDWDPGLPIKLDRIRDKDEDYWDDYRGTPKAFVTLAAGQSMWANRYGDLTAVRFESVPARKDSLAESLRKSVDPGSLGLSVTPVQDIGLRARGGGTDFAQLFLGLSMFLIASGILLTGMLFIFAIESRQKQTGMLLAIGFPVRRIQRLYLLEGSLVAFLGAVTGTLLGVIYTRLLVYALSTTWQGAMAGTVVRFAASTQSQCMGMGTGFVVSFLAMALTLRRQMKAPSHLLMSGVGSLRQPQNATTRNRLGLRLLSMLSLGVAVILIAISPSLGSGAMAGAFFGAGTLLLISLITWIRMVMGRMDIRSHRPLNSLISLALRNGARRPGRSLAVVTMLACGVFMVVAVGANRKNPAEGAQTRSSGTGGFSLYGEASVPLFQDLNSDAGCRAWGLDASILKETRFVPIRVRDGDDASCLNLNRAQTPRILGVPLDQLKERNAFSFRETVPGADPERPWDLLRKDLGEGIIPAIGDYPTVFWGLGKTIGDNLVYRDRNGRNLSLRIVGMMTSSILQGSLIISEKAMMQYFPEVEGHRLWLMDTPVQLHEQVSRHLTRRLANAGFSVETTIERLSLFGQVENTYLTIFMVLGGFGLVIGCVGLGLVVARNLLERQGELAMLRALGFCRRTLLKMVCLEHGFLLAAGLITGIICALVAVMPSLRGAFYQLPFGLLALLITLIALSGIFWVVIAAAISLRGDILTPLRNE